MKDDDLSVLCTRLANCWKLAKVDFTKENAAKALLAKYDEDVKELEAKWMKKHTNLEMPKQEILDATQFVA